MGRNCHNREPPVNLIILWTSRKPHWYEEGKEYKALKSEVIKFRKAADKAGSEGQPGVGLGMDFRIDSRWVTGFGLVLNDQILHLSVFARADGRDKHAADSRIEKFSRRRRNRRV